MKTKRRLSRLIPMLAALAVMTSSPSPLGAQNPVNNEPVSKPASKKTADAITPAVVGGSGTTGQIPLWLDGDSLGSSIITQSIGKNGRIGIGATSPTSRLTVNGIVESLTGGFKFPDETTQTTAFKVPLLIFGSTSVGNALIHVSNNDTGIAIQGISSQGTGVSGTSATGSGINGVSTDGKGVYGFSPNGTGVYALSGGSNIPAVLANNPAPSGQGVYAGAADGIAVIGDSSISTQGVGVWGINQSSGLAGKFTGNVQVTGTLTKGGGSFKIDHPLDPGNKYLYHSFVESPDMMNIYNGNVKLDQNGEAIVELPEWFGTLNKDFRYLLTALGAPGPNLYIAEEVANNHFKIAGGAPGMKISWQVTGIRQDAWANAHRISVEEQKTERERGYFLHPELYGQPNEKSVEWARHPELMKQAKRDREKRNQ